MRLDDLVQYLDGFLRIRDVTDDRNAVNGLQVANTGEVRRIAAAVDACQATIDATAERRADLLLVHHGLFWGGLEPLTGRAYRRAAALLRNDIAVYSCHLPLDLHPEVGNNAVLARKLGMTVSGWFGDYLGAPIGICGEIDLPREELRALVAGVLGVPVRLIPGGPERSRRVGVITGAAGSLTRQAAEAGLDTFITGEGQHWTFHDAQEFGVNVLHAGHYATETLGVQALAAHLAERFQLTWTFVDHPTGL